MLRLDRRWRQAGKRGRDLTAGPLKILRVIARLNVGGPARHVVLLNRGLEDRGHRTLLVHGSIDADEASLEPLAADERVPTVRVAPLGRRISPLDDVRALIRLVRLMFLESPDVIHTHTAKAGALGRLAAIPFNATRGRRRRCIVVHTFHGHVLEGYFSPAISATVRFVERTLAHMSDRIVTISPGQRLDIVERFRIADRAKTVVVPLGLELGPLLQLQPAAPTYRTELGLDSEDIVVGYVGRLVPIKDLGTLVRAFALALRSEPKLQLVLAGDGPTRSEIETMSTQLGIASRTHLMGWTDDLKRLYSTLDICVLSSRNEGTPVTIIEAMAAGKAVVATAVGGVPDVMVHGETGLLVPAGDSRALAEAIVELASDQERRERMGSAGRAHVATRYSPNRLVSDMERLYAEALLERRGP